MTFASDFRLNFDLGFDRAIRCHHNVDFAISTTGDILLTEAEAESMLQRLFLWMSIKYGEVPGHPELGCCIYPYFYKKATKNNFAALAQDIKTDLNRFVPGLEVTKVTVRPATTSGRIDAVQIDVITARQGTVVMEVGQSDADTPSILESLGPMLDFSRASNSMQQNVGL